MGRYYKRRYYRSGVSGRDKYSVEQNAGSLQVNASGDGGVTVVPATSIQGMRKVKHLTLNMANYGTGSASVLYWALVYVPAGTSANTLQVDSGSMYEPNQYVMSSGVFDFDGGPLRVHCPLSRNLNSGDTIALVVHSLAATVTYYYTLSYAITLQ